MSTAQNIIIFPDIFRCICASALDSVRVLKADRSTDTIHWRIGCQIVHLKASNDGRFYNSCYVFFFSLSSTKGRTMIIAFFFRGFHEKSVWFIPEESQLTYVLRLRKSSGGVRPSFHNDWQRITNRTQSNWKNTQIRKLRESFGRKLNQNIFEALKPSKQSPRIVNGSSTNLWEKSESSHLFPQKLFPWSNSMQEIYLVSFCFI